MFSNLDVREYIYVFSSSVAYPKVEKPADPDRVTPGLQRALRAERAKQATKGRPRIKRRLLKGKSKPRLTRAKALKVPHDEPEDEAAGDAADANWPGSSCDCPLPPDLPAPRSHQPRLFVGVSVS